MAAASERRQMRLEPLRRERVSPRCGGTRSLPSWPVPDASIEEQLDDLQRQSEQRSAELREIAAQHPATMSRRAILRAVAADFRHSPGKLHVVNRAARKLMRAPRAAVRAVRHAVRRGERNQSRSTSPRPATGS